MKNILSQKNPKLYKKLGFQSGYGASYYNKKKQIKNLELLSFQN
jgi:hypothetical protein